MDVTLVEHQSALALLKLNGDALETFGRARGAGFDCWKELARRV